MVSDVKTSVAFFYDDIPVFIISSHDDREEVMQYLRSRIFVLHTMESFELIANGLYKCVIRGSDGQRYRMHFTAESAMLNMGLVGSELETTLPLM